MNLFSPAVWGDPRWELPPITSEDYGRYVVRELVYPYRNAQQATWMAIAVCFAASGFAMWLAWGIYVIGPPFADPLPQPGATLRLALVLIGIIVPFVSGVALVRRHQRRLRAVREIFEEFRAAGYPPNFDINGRILTRGMKLPPAPVWGPPLRPAQGNTRHPLPGSADRCPPFSAGRG